MWPAAAAGGRRCSRGPLPSTTFGAVHSLKPYGRLHNRRAEPGVVVGAVRDGKKRRKPASKTGGGSSSDEEAGSPLPPPPPPRRVDPSLNIPVRRQQRWARLVKEQMRLDDPRVYRPKNPARAFRKETLDSEEHRRRREQQELQAEEARRYKSETGTLAQMFNTSVSAPGEQPLGVTLVDGYNMLYSMRGRDPRVRELMEEAAANNSDSGALEAARQYLLRQLDVYSSQEGMYVHVVLDAMGRGYSSQHNKLGMIVEFCGDQEADTMILTKAQEYIDQGVTKVCIVTDDLGIVSVAPAVKALDPVKQAVFGCSCTTLSKLLVESQKKLDRRLKMQRLDRGLGSLSAVVTQKPAAAGAGSQKQSLLSLRQSLVQHEQQAARQGQRQTPQARKPPQ